VNDVRRSERDSMGRLTSDLHLGAPGSITFLVIEFILDEVALWRIFSGYFGFPYQVSFHRLLQNKLPSEAGTIGLIVVGLPSGLGLKVIYSKYTFSDILNKIYPTFLRPPLLIWLCSSGLTKGSSETPGIKGAPSNCRNE
jgi:hypothetical protein